MFILARRKINEITMWNILQFLYEPFQQQGVPYNVGNKGVPYNVYLINSHISFKLPIRIQRIKL